MLKSKLHRATVTGRDVDYIGSITIDAELMERAELLVNEQVHVWDVANGARFMTYVIAGERGSGAIEVNGAAAHLVSEGDKLIVASFAGFDREELVGHAPVVVHVDSLNRVTHVDARSDVLHAGIDSIPLG
jgi:aspartate 1-decarboxylase